ncbi:MAG TPA: magnesium-translocating P-type ATPase [Firmicutes bacterium]|nr:magnesium-translocating P-type ATPase [Bacillota bacterium]
MKKISRSVFSASAERLSRPAAADRVRRAAEMPAERVCSWLGTGEGGLCPEEVAARRAQYGSNAIRVKRASGTLRRLAGAFLNPFTLILVALAVVTLLTDVVFAAPSERNPFAVAVIAGMVLISGGMRFVQETRSGRAAERLSSMIAPTACIVRGGVAAEIPVQEIVVGDLVKLSAGDMLPADVRILAAKDLFVSQSALTGESAPAEKCAAAEKSAPLESACLAFAGTNVLSGSGTGIAVAVGRDTQLGQAAGALTQKPEKTAFDRGVDAVSGLLIRLMLVMVPVVFLINGFTKGDWLNAGLFAVSVAVGLTPEMLPMIVTTCLAKGAVAMSKKKVIVKNLNAIQNLGAMDVLCTDKTGTLTQDRVVLELHLDVTGKEDVRVLRYAYLNSNHQTGLKNLMDAAVIARAEELCAAGGLDAELLYSYRKTDEIPFDFERRRMSVVVQDRNGREILVTKGAVEEMLAVSSHAEYGGGTVALTAELRREIAALADGLNAKGMRVLALARRIDPPAPLTAADERDMTLVGLLAFLDPPKPTTAAVIRRLKRAGVAVKVLTGDNEKVAACICEKVGLRADRVLLGSDIDGMSDEELSAAAEETAIFAKLSPAQKARVVALLRKNGHAVGYMGDGINDAPAMRAADVGISVDSAADVAKEAAGVILLEKDLTVVADGVAEGRRTYVNMMKYVRITASSNFGNMFSVLVASAFLPFLPMLALQLMILNFAYDISCAAIPWDRADAASLARPAAWDAKSVMRFMLWFGPVSSLFDILTYALLFFAICPNACGAPYSALGAAGKEQFAALFRTGWFIESACTQMLVLHLLRTERFSRASRPALSVCALTAGGLIVLTALPLTPLGGAVDFTAPPAEYWIVLVCIVTLYIIAAWAVKKIYVRRYGRLM